MNCIHGTPLRQTPNAGLMHCDECLSLVVTLGLTPHWLFGDAIGEWPELLITHERVKQIVESIR